MKALTKVKQQKLDFFSSLSIFLTFCYILHHTKRLRVSTSNKMSLEIYNLNAKVSPTRLNVYHQRDKVAMQVNVT